MTEKKLRKTVNTLVVTMIFITINFTTVLGTELRDDTHTVDESTNSFYFIQLTDTHVISKMFDKKEVYKNRLKTVLNHILSFTKKPAFIVITGDLVEWGSGLGGILNYKAFKECFHEKENQLYADPNYNIPVYTTPGNHDYFWGRTLLNYHRLIDNKHIWENDRYTITFEDTTLFFLDSGHNELNYEAKPLDWIYVLGSGLSIKDLEWLDESLNSCESKHKIILMHHPAVNWGKYDVISHNREPFISICEGYNVDLVLAGHTHAARVFESDGTFYPNDVLPLNCSLYPTLYVQTDAIKEGYYYRNITISGDTVWVEPCEEYQEY
ncbi:MAG TPA: hypothetical protein ENI42_01800, partial [Thermoplasmatales archaeon]|nr:hypothetical protein [Thermoplasmatales archaeon]